MSTFARSPAAPNGDHPLNDAVALSRLEARLPPLLSVIAGMVCFYLVKRACAPS